MSLYSVRSLLTFNNKASIVFRGKRLDHRRNNQLVISFAIRFGQEIREPHNDSIERLRKAMSLYSFRSPQTQVSIIPRRELSDHRPNNPSMIPFANSVLAEIRKLHNERNENTRKATSLYSDRSQQDFNKGMHEEPIRIITISISHTRSLSRAASKLHNPSFGLPPSTTFFHMIIPLEFRYPATPQQVLLLTVGAHF